MVIADAKNVQKRHWILYDFVDLNQEMSEPFIRKKNLFFTQTSLKFCQYNIIINYKIMSFELSNIKENLKSLLYIFLHHQ